MIDFNDIALFVQVARCGSFSEAGRRLGMPPNTVSRRIQELEDHLGSRLMQRSTRKLTLTDAGQELLERCAEAVDSLQQASQDLTAGRKVPSGLVRVTSTANFLDFYTAETAAAFLEQYPQVRLEFLLDDAMVDLVADRIDVAFRSGADTETGYIAHRMPVPPIALFASPAYVGKYGTPRTLAELTRHRCLTVPHPSSRALWRLQGPEGVEEQVDVGGPFSVGNTRALHQAAVAGLGIALLPSVITVADIARGALVPILPQYSRRNQSLCVVYPSHRQVSPAVKAFVASVMREFEQALALHGA